MPKIDSWNSVGKSLIWCHWVIGMHFNAMNSADSKMYRKTLDRGGCNSLRSRVRACNTKSKRCIRLTLVEQFETWRPLSSVVFCTR